MQHTSTVLGLGFALGVPGMLAVIAHALRRRP